MASHVIFCSIVLDVLPPENKADDRAKGKAVMYQLGGYFHILLEVLCHEHNTDYLY